MKGFDPGPVENHRDREGGAIVYPVYSRRSRGLSVGINLFPDRKVCSFDCPYCEVFPFRTDLRFSLPVMEEALRGALAEAADRGIPVRDICFSGNGEPSISPDFREALEAAGRLRDRMVPEAALVVITNGTGLLNEETFAFMREAALGAMRLDIWLKLDAGTPAWYKTIDRSAVPFDVLAGRIRKFAGLAPVTLQTMVCAVGGKAPPAEEEAAWVRLAAELAGCGGGLSSGVRAVQIYGKARPAPEDPLAEALPEAFLERRAAALRAVTGTAIPVEVFP
jgi:histidinol dehydrogenase